MQVGDEARDALIAVVEDASRPAHHVLRARIVLLASEGMAPGKIARRVGSCDPVVRKWIRRYSEAGLECLLKEATLHPGRPSISPDVVAEVLRLTKSPPTGKRAWSGRSMAKAVGISARTVHRIWRANGLP